MINLSIIVPVFNGEKSLNRCLTSILDSYSLTTGFTIEIITINDGSTDASLEVLKDFKKEYNFIKIINKENEGVYIARNLALKSVLGEFVWMLDADDFIALNALDSISKKIMQSKPDIINFGYCQEIKNNIFKKYQLSSFYNELQNIDGLTFLEKNDGRLYLWNNIYNVSFLEKYKIKFLGKSKSLEDSLFNIEAYRAAKHVSFINQELYSYCFNPLSISRNHTITKLMVLRESTLNIHKQLLKILNSIKNKNTREYIILNAKLNHSVLGFFYSLLMQKYPVSVVKETISLYRNLNLYPIKLKSATFKGNLFRMFLNIEWLYLLFCRFLRQVN